jgi:hypothetical protein
MFSESNFDFAMICEDDVDFSNSLKINFSFVKEFDKFKSNDFCLQTSVSSREEDNIDFFLHDRSFWHFGTISYIVSKTYANNVLNFYSKDLNFFVSRAIKDPRGGEIYTRPVADELVYSLCKTKVIPLFTFFLSESDISYSDEQYRQNKKNRDDFLKYWGTVDIIDIKKLIKENK